MNKQETKKDSKGSNKRSSTLQGNRLFLTISATNLTEDWVYTEVLRHETPHLSELAVVTESHKDGSKHIHVYLRYKKRREVSLRRFDYLCNGVHVEKVRDRNRLLDYLTKENKPMANFDLWSDLLKQSRTFATTLETMVNRYGFDLAAIQSKYSHQIAGKPWQTVSKFVAESNKLQKQFGKVYPSLRVIDQRLVEERLSPQEREVYDANPAFRRLIAKLNDLKANKMHEHKQCTLALVGSASIGKSSFLMKLAQFYPSYDFPNDGWHHKTYPNYFYSTWIWNEYSLVMPGLSWEELLLLFEGLPVDLRIKGSKTHKEDRPMLFLTSNVNLNDQVRRKFGHLRRICPKVYAVRLESLKCRVDELDFGDTNIFFLQKLLVPEV